MKIRLALYIPRPNYGGVTKVLLNLAKGLSEKIDVVVVTYKGCSLDALALSDKSELQYIELPTSSALISVFSLGYLVRKKKITHVITASPVTNCVSVLSKKIFLNNAKVIITEHTMVSVEARFKGGKVYKFLPFLMSLLYPKADKILAISKGIKNDLIDYAKINHKRIVVLNNAVLDKDFSVKKKELVHHHFFETNEKVIVFVGRFESVKNPLLLVSAFDILVEKLDARLIFIGDGPLEQDAKKYVSDLNLSDKVSFLGYVKNPIPYIFRSDLLALTSRWEGMPGVMIEALACETPMVATDCAPGVKEIFEKNTYGKIVPNYDPNAFADALYEVLSEEVDLDDMQVRANDFTSRHVVKQYLKLLV